jgi:carbon starvation protein CstA
MFASAHQYVAPWTSIGRAGHSFGRLAQVKENGMSLGMILLIVLILMLVGSVPTWGYSSGWGYGPSGGLGLVVLIVLILLLLGKI